MRAAEIRQRFLEYFERNGHVVRPSSSLVPGDDPTLLFTNAGMVQFKRVFLGEEPVPYRRAVTSQKCLRVSGKHNDLEEVGVTSRHHTFFEMLGNFSFGDYFKRDAIRYAWELMTEVFGLPASRLWVTVHHTDDEAASLWRDVAGVRPERIFRLGDEDNFWQMGDTGPCGPCSEIHCDMRTGAEAGTEVTIEAFEALGSAGRFLELWNLVFMQYDRSADGTLTPLPAPSIDTGAGLERLASVLQGVESNYDTDLFLPLIARAAEAIGRPYDAAAEAGVSYRVLADHARACAFLIADGVFPSNDGRGYVLRRILRRAVRHAWLQGRREPTLVHVVDAVVDLMGDAYPELTAQRGQLQRVVRDEEQRFLDTIDAGMARLDAAMPALPAAAGVVEAGTAPPVLPGEEAFRLHDTFGFPLDLTQLIARERGYEVDVTGFAAALEAQRARSRGARADTASVTARVRPVAALSWRRLSDAGQTFVGYDTLDVETRVTAVAVDGGRAGVVLRENPFYLEAGGQVSDVGTVEGDGWRIDVAEVVRVDGRVGVVGPLAGVLPAADAPLWARAVVVREVRRDTQRNHTATHLLHAALREVLGAHVLQRGSLVAPERLRFDFAHTKPLTPDEVRAVEGRVNAEIFADHAVRTEHTTYADAVGRGAMALFGEKYGDVVRVVVIPGVSLELCGGTHVAHTGEVGVFRIVGESGIAAGVRRVEAVTGPGAYRRWLERDALLEGAAAMLKVPVDQLLRRIEHVTAEARELRRQLERVRAGAGGDVVSDLIARAVAVDGARVVTSELDVGGVEELRQLGDRLRERLGTGAAVLAGRHADRVALLAVVTDDLLSRGVRADALVREVARLTGGSGGGRPHMAQGGAGDPTKVPEALARALDMVRELLGGAAP
jgi:alanyl-tRNA synthetase